MKLSPKYCWAMVVCALLPGQVRAGATTLTFEGLKNFEGVADYYNGGKGSLGTGPGPKNGITFNRFAIAYIPGEQSGKTTPFPGDPSPPTVLLLNDLGGQSQPGSPISTTMDVSGGFVGSLSFYDINISKGATSVKIYSGLDGGGTLLAQQNLAMTQEAFGNPYTVSFKGIAHSVVFAGGNAQLALDNISLKPASPAPEPSTMVLVVFSLPFMWAARRSLNASRA